MKDIYFEPNYGKIYENLENGKSVFYEFKNEIGYISNLFIKREIPIKLNNGTTYFDITTPYGYGGPIINEVLDGKKEELVKAYEEDFKKYCEKHNIVSEFIRFHPLFNNDDDFSDIYEVETLRKTVGTNLIDYDDPFQSEFSKSTRKTTRRALREGVTFEVITEPESAQEFLNIYYSTMDRNNASDYYYFEEDYFNQTIKYFKKNIILVKAIYQEKTIAMGFYFKYKNIIHSHLSGTLNDYLNLSPAYIIKYATTLWGKENGYHLIHHGGGTTNDENDGLYKFKHKFGQNTKFDFSIGKKIWDPTIYSELVKKSENDKKNTDFFPAYRK